MRKWMRDRIRRRKQAKEAQPTTHPPAIPESQPAAQTPRPLQPTFYHQGMAREAPEQPTFTEPKPVQRRADRDRGAEITQGERDKAPARPPSGSSFAGETSAQPGFAGSPTPAPGRSAGTSSRRGWRRRRKSPRGGVRPTSNAAAPPQLGLQHPPVGAPRVPQPAQIPAPRPRTEIPMPRGMVVLAIGLPGSGKTTWFKRRGVTPLSSDLLRTLLFDNITEQRYQDLVFSTLRALLRARLISRMPWNYVDATNLSPHERRQWIKMARDFGYEVQAVFFDVPLEVCIDRNRRRERVVPEDVMRRMAAKLRQPTFDEGFSKITVVRVKPK